MISAVRYINRLIAAVVKPTRRAKKSTEVKLSVKLPQKFIDVFDVESYLKANPDVASSVSRGRHEGGLQHFQQIGYWEVKDGGRRIGDDFPHFNAEVYLKYNLDIAFLNTKQKAYEHFIEHGYSEFKRGDRSIIGYYPLLSNANSIDKVKKHFDEEAYLQANPDIVRAIEDGTIENAWDHFEKYGIYEAQKLGRPLNVIVGNLTEPEYFFKFPDLKVPLRNGVIDSPFEHFISHGLAEIVNGKRVIHAYGGYDYQEPKLGNEAKAELAKFTYRPLISIVIPVYNVDEQWLVLAIQSIERQWYSNWEICIADDASTKEETVNYLRNVNSSKIKIVHLTENLNISGASNAALSIAEGDFIALMDNDDELTPDALYEVVKAINEGAEFIYSDEDKLELNGRYTDPHFKPDFSPDMFMSHNYISHLGVIKKSLVESVGGWSIGLEGAQDYDLYLKVLEKTQKIKHIPKVLYHWRKVPGSTAAVFGDKSYAQDAGLKSLQNALKRRGVDGRVEHGVSPGLYNVKYNIISEPLVSIVVPFKDKPDLLKQCVEAVLEKTTYKNFELIGISNNSENDTTFEEMKRLEGLDKRVKFYEFNEPFNYSRVNNYAVTKYARGEYIAFMNNDIEVITPEWIEELLMHAQRDSIGCVGAKLLYENSTIQHAGIVLAPETKHLVVPAFSGFPRNAIGYAARLATVCNYSAVTAALLMIKKNVFKKIGGFNEDRLSIAYNDVDLCLKAKAIGLNNIYNPYAEAFHYESLSRGYDTESIEKLERMAGEARNLLELNEEEFSSYDSCYNPNLDANDVSFRIAPHVGRLNKQYIGRKFTEQIVAVEDWGGAKQKRLCLFSHFDQDQKLDEYVLFYLDKLSEHYDIVFITTSARITKSEISKLKKYCISAVVKENYGYDFGAWKTGLNQVSDIINNYESVLLCNDSVYGPFQELGTTIKSMEEKGYDVWSMTDNFEIGYHLQSYFVQYSKKAFCSSVFQKFWDNFIIYDDKPTLIKNNEILYSRQLISDEKLKVGAFYSSEEKSSLNSLQYYWDEMLRNDFPFLKVEVLKKNPLNCDLSGFEDVISENSSYNTVLIKNHLDRVK